MKIRPGEIVHLKPTVVSHMEERTVKGKVVYINRKHRYFTAEFSFPGGKFREAFKFDGRGYEHDRP